MGWKEVSIMSERREFVGLAGRPEANIRELCRRYGISPTTGYKWLDRSADEDETFEDRSRRPHTSPTRTSETVEKLVLEVRDEHPVWNARKIRRVLAQRGCIEVPAASTVGEILKRHGRITPAASEAAHAWQRFEHPRPNDLSQMDFKGHFATGEGRCYPLTMLDDHSRYNQLLESCADERMETVQPHLISSFRRFGTPVVINVDNGNPWGNANGDRHTKLTVWLIRVGVGVSHSRPMHPQTNGKDERFHRTLKAEVLSNRWFATIKDVQRAFDRWREIYNHERPHEGIGLEVPASRYSASPRPYPEVLPPVEYNESDLVQKVRTNGMLYVWKEDYYIGQAFAGQPVALRPTSEDGMWDVFLCREKIATVNRRQRSSSLEH